MNDNHEKRLGLGAIIRDKRSHEYYRVTALNKHLVCYTGIRGVKASGATPKGRFKKDFVVIKEGRYGS